MAQPMDAAALAAARKAAAERFYAIGMSYVPSGWEVRFRKSLSGHAYYTTRLIQAPKPVTRKALYIFLHECAHAHLHSTLKKGSRAVHVKELEAEKWAHEKMREHGIAVPRAMTDRAKAYVARKIRQAERRGAKKIDAEARRFSKR